jgi:hypothetical protein
MTELSQKQLEANRQNAQLGGVKTEEGKAVSKYNAIKHGLLSEEVLLEGEDETSLITFGKKIRAELKPETEFELLLVDRIIANSWRLKRTMRVEIGMIKDSCSSSFGGEKSIGEALNSDFMHNDNFGKFTRYETSIERGIYKALHELQRIQSVRLGEKVPAPIAIDVDISKE